MATAEPESCATPKSMCSHKNELWSHTVLSGLVQACSDLSWLVQACWNLWIASIIVRPMPLSIEVSQWKSKCNHGESILILHKFHVWSSSSLNIGATKEIFTWKFIIRMSPIHLAIQSLSTPKSIYHGFMFFLFYFITKNLNQNNGQGTWCSVLKIVSLKIQSSFSDKGWSYLLFVTCEKWLVECLGLRWLFRVYLCLSWLFQACTGFFGLVRAVLGSYMLVQACPCL